MFRSAGEGENSRSASDVPIEEAVNAIYYILGNIDEPAGSDELIRCAGEVMKLSSDGAEKDRLFNNAVSYGVRVKNLERDDDGNISLTANGKKRAQALISNIK